MNNSEKFLNAITEKNDLAQGLIIYNAITTCCDSSFEEIATEASINNYLTDEQYKSIMDDIYFNSKKSILENAAIFVVLHQNYIKLKQDGQHDL